MAKPTRRERERQARADAIVQAAREVFEADGYDDASMDDIAKRAEFTKRTLYQYFASKQDLFFAVILYGFRRQAEYLESATTGTTGLQRFVNSVHGYQRFYRQNTGLFRLMNAVGYVRWKRENKESRFLQDWLRFDDNMFAGIASVIESGQNDGTIRSDIDPKITAYSLAFVLNRFFTGLATAGDTFVNHFDLDHDEFVRSSIQLVVDAIATER